MFDPKALIAEDKVRTVVDPELGTIKYSSLRLMDVEEVNKAATPMDRGAYLAWYYLKRAYPSLTLDNVKNMPLDKVAKILSLITKNEEMQP